jgi:hypothetical protein
MLMLQAGGITEPPVEMDFYRRFQVTRLWKKIISTGIQRRRFANPPVEKSWEPPV